MIVLTHGYFIAEDAREQSIMKPYVPLGILYISGFLEEHGIQHDVYDSTFSSFNDFAGYLNDRKPALIGIYTNLMTKVNVLKMIRHIRSQPFLSECRVVLGGPEIRYNAKNYLAQGADMLVIGEGEQTFCEIAKNFKERGMLPLDVPGTAYLLNGEPHFTPERTLIKSLDDIPFPSRHKIDLTLYTRAWKERHGYSMLSISTMRGCPYTCKWCSRAVYGGTYRRRSASLIVTEMEALQRTYGPDRIWFVDDVFTINHKWLRQFHAEVLKRKVMIPYEIITRADRMNAEVITLLRESGCFRVWIGAESGAQEIINAMDRRVDVAQVRQMIIDTRKAGMQAGTFIMLGYPGEKRRHIRQTIEHLVSARPDEYTITLAYPITGTPLHEEVLGSVKQKAQWEVSTDRDSDFKRTHSTRFYRHAIKWIYNEVGYAREPRLLRRLRYKTKSLLAQTLMIVADV